MMKRNAVVHSIVLGIALFVGTACGEAADVYVSNSTDGNDTTGKGTAAEPYKTIQKAISTLAGPPATHTIWVRSWSDDGKKVVDNCDYTEIIDINNKIIIIRPYKLVKGKEGKTTSRIRIAPKRAATGNPGADGAPTITVRGGASVNLKYVKVTGQAGGHGDPKAANAEGGNGAPGIKAVGVGTVISKFKCRKAVGGKGGNGANGGGDGGDGAPAEQSDGAHIKNHFDSPAEGGEGGRGGAGSSGGSGGPGARAENGGLIEWTPSASLQSSGGAGGPGTPAGQPGAKSEADGSSEVNDLTQEGDEDQDGHLDDADNCPDDYNPGQEDGDGDDIGDACEPGEGACELTGNLCVQTSESECDEMGGWYEGDLTDCPEDSSCGTHVPIPTVSEWGMIIMGLLLLTAATITIRRQHRRTPVTECS
ncbi:MAG: IPTL-CTERM sorting domain-containing protein [bacterium]|nr:IPTL-CTERM sorting domain-containing protein [bacterium]